MLRRSGDNDRRSVIVGFCAGHIASDADGVTALERGDRL
jgi:hypothetical protein